MLSATILLSTLRANTSYGKGKQIITKISQFKYTENFTTKNDNFPDKKNLIFFIVSIKT